MRWLALLRHLLSADYLYALAPLAGDAGRGALWVWAAFWLAVEGGAYLWRRCLVLRGQSPWAAYTLGSLGLLGVAATGAQALGRGLFSARIWAFSLAGLALALPASCWLAGRRWPAWARPVGRALAAGLSPDDPPPSAGWQLGWLLLHTAGLGGLLLTEEITPCLLALAGACLAATALLSGRVRVEILAPLILPYGAALARAFVQGALGVESAPYQAFPYPDLWSIWFDGRTPLVMGVAWMLASTLALAWRRCPRPGLIVGGAAGTAAFWWAALYGRHLSHGASGSDPYCYLQMAADLAATGSLRHFFPLTALAHAAQVPVWPLVPVGYHPPLDGWAATVWPPGWPILLAPLVRLGGEALALWGAPLCLLAAAGLTYRLARASLPQTRPSAALLAGLAAAGIMLTSLEGLTRSLVPMADAAVAALSAGTALALVRARGSDRLGWSAAAGLALALAYDVRHPQLPLALAALPAYLLAPWPGRRKLQHLLLFCAVACVGALPDLIYHTRVWGTPWISESPEWFLLSPRYLGVAWGRLWEDGIWRRGEYGYLWPLVACGLAAQLRSRREREVAWLLLAGFMGVLLFQLCYAALRLRDLIGLFPWLALWAGRGALALWRWAAQGPRPHPRRAGVLLILVTLLAARSAGALSLPWRSRVATFGYISAEERAGLGQLAAWLPEGAVVGTSLNAGAVARYTGHESIRPAAWAPDEFDRFVAQLASAGRLLYLLIDGEEMAEWLPSLDARYPLIYQGSVAAPLYGRGGQALEGDAALYLLGFPE